MAQYAAAGYCNKDGTVGDVVSCEESACPDVVGNGATIIATLDGDWESTGGAVIRDDVNKAIVVSFAGTVSESIMTWILEYVLACCAHGPDFRFTSLTFE